MRVLFSITRSSDGGAQTYIYQLCKELSKSGHEFALISHPEGWLGSAVEELGGEFYPNPYFINSLNPFSYFKNNKVIKEAFKDFKPDIVSCHSGFAGFMTRVSVRNKVPTVFTAHGWTFSPGVSIVRKFLSILAERFASLYCNTIICVSEFDKKLALRYRITEEDKLVVIHNGVELEQLESNIKGNSEVRIIFVGRLVGQKDPELLLKAFSELPDGLINKTNLVIVGDGNKKDRLLNTIQKEDIARRVFLLGSLPRKKVLEELNVS